LDCAALLRVRAYSQDQAQLRARKTAAAPLAVPRPS